MKIKEEENRYITNEKINKNLKKHKYVDRYGVVHTTDNKYKIN